MIGLDIDLSYLSLHYHIADSALKQYQNMSITQIMETEAEKGNKAAAAFMLQVSADPEKLCKLFNLVEPKNRFLILQNMNQEDLMNVMQFLDPMELILGLSIFNKDVIVELMKNMDPASLATVVLEKMEPQKFLKLIPEDYLDEFLDSDKITREMMMKSFEQVDEEQLQKMYENYYGVSCSSSREEILEEMGNLSDDNFMRMTKAAEPKGKQQLIFGMLREKPELFEEFSADAMTHPFQTMEKNEVLKSLTVLETQEMLPMVEDLPQELMALIATQIAPEMLAKILTTDFKDVIANCGMKS